MRRDRLLLAGGGAAGGPPQLSAADFGRHALRFMAVVGLPYLAQRTAVESINAHLERTFLHRLTYSLSVQLVLADGESHLEGS